MTDSRVDASSIDLAVRVATFATGWGAAIARPRKLEVATTHFESSAPKAISLRVGPAAVKTFSYAFPELPQRQTSSTPDDNRRVRQHRPGVESGRPGEGAGRPRPGGLWRR